jgi:hypothetical protein
MTSQSQLTVSAPFWGPEARQLAASATSPATALARYARRHHLGGPAIIAFVFLLWALFLGTVGVTAEGGESRAGARAPTTTAAVAETR